jgi:hypothetical protein
MKAPITTIKIRAYAVIRFGKGEGINLASVWVALTVPQLAATTPHQTPIGFVSFL